MEDYVFNKSSLKNGKIVLEDVIMDKQTNAAKKMNMKNPDLNKYKNEYDEQTLM